MTADPLSTAARDPDSRANAPNASDPVALAAVGMAKSYGAVAVLERIDLAVVPGEVLAVLGPSGCGKSTLLRVLAGLEPPDRGRVVETGRPVDGPSPARPMVAQASTLFPWLSLRANLEWGPRALGKPDAGAVADALLEATGLTGFAGSLPRQLSGGMRQRAAIAQVMANEPPVLLLDEPFGALDAQTRLRMQEWLLGLLARRPTAVILVTHDVEEALLLGDRLVLLSHRPARVVEHRDVPLPAGRSRATLTDPVFVSLKAQVLGQVLDT